MMSSKFEEFLGFTTFYTTFGRKDMPQYAIGKRWWGGGNVPKPLAKAAYLGINLHSLEF